MSTQGPKPPAPLPTAPAAHPGAARPSFGTALSVFSNRHYRLLWTSSLFSFTGMQMQQVARALLAWDLTHSFGAVGAISLSFGLPMLVFSLIGGSLADRFEKRNLTLASQVVTGALALVNAVMVATGTITFEWLFVLGLFGGTSMALGMPARTPLMAQVVGPESVMSAIAMSNAAMNATRLFGPAVAGAMVGLWDLESVYFAQAGFYVLSCLTLLMVPTGLGREVEGGPMIRPRSSMFREIGAGVRYVATDPSLRMLNGMMVIVSLFAMPYVMLLAGFVHEDLHRGAGAFGMLQSVSGVGALVGSLGIATLTAFDRKGLVQWLSGLVGGAALIGLALGSSAFGFAGAVGAIAVLGLALTAYQTLNSTMIMDVTRPDYYGRVMSINMLSFSIMPLMAYPMGEIADVVGARETFVAQGLLVIGFMGIAAMVNPRYTFGKLTAPIRQGWTGPGTAFRGGGHAEAREVGEEAATAGGGS